MRRKGPEYGPEVVPGQIEEEPIDSIQFWMDRLVTFRIEYQMNMGQIEANRVANAVENLNAALNGINEHERPSREQLAEIEMSSLQGAEKYFSNKNQPLPAYIAYSERLKLKAGLIQEHRDQGDI